MGISLLGIKIIILSIKIYSPKSILKSEQDLNNPKFVFVKNYNLWLTFEFFYFEFSSKITNLDLYKKINELRRVFGNKDYSIFSSINFMELSIFVQPFLSFQMLSLNSRNVPLMIFQVLVYQIVQKYFAILYLDLIEYKH
jgi:hypothetical protein